MALSIILGTRPEIIKMSPIIRLCKKKSIPHYILHSGQHYDYEMDETFFLNLDLPQPKFNLKVGSGTHAEQTGKIMLGIENIIRNEDTKLIFVEGDTNTVLAGALTASKLLIKIGHVEAGLRSFDRTMPEEINRIVADHLSDILFAPTEESKGNLLKEGIDEKKIHITGNTIVDSIRQNLIIAKRESKILEKLSLKKKKYIVATAHRAENVDDVNKLQGILLGLHQVSEQLDIPVIYPMHPRTKKMMNLYKLKTNYTKIISPLGYLDFLLLLSKAKLILTDSGGVQEEACVLKIPCLTLRENTERPETIKVGANKLVGTTPKRILEGAKKMIEVEPKWKNPFGDGHSAEKIMSIIKDVLI